jgi:hypothetical protein
MPRYYFNVDDDNSTLDTEGSEIETLAKAKCEAVKMAGRIICDAAGKFWDRAEWSMTVTDGAGLTLFTLDFMGTEAPAIHPHSFAG